MMKKVNYHLLFFLTLFILGGNAIYGQIKLGDNIDQMSAYALLELESEDKGFLVNRMSSEQRDAAFNQDAPVGLMIYNTDANEIQYLRFELDPAGKVTDHKVWEAATDDTAVSAGDAFPTSPSPGNLFYNELEDVLYVWNSLQTTWLPVGGASRSGTISNEFLTYTNSDGSTATLDLSTLSSTDSQTLTVSNTLLSISQGNSVDLAPLVNAIIATSTSGISTATTTAGPAGPAGAPGAPGAAGVDGAGFLVGTGVPGSTVASTSFYVDDATGDEYYNVGGGSTWTLLPSSDNQQLTASALSANSTMTLAISNGNTVTLDLSALENSGTDSQTLTASAKHLGQG